MNPRSRSILLLSGAAAAFGVAAASSLLAECPANDATHEYFEGEYVAGAHGLYPPGFDDLSDGWTPLPGSPENPIVFGATDQGIQCQAFEAAGFYGNAVAYKQYTLEEGKTYRIHVWARWSNYDENYNPSSLQSWVEYGHDKTGQIGNNAAATLVWDIDIKAPANFEQRWGQWIEFSSQTVTMDQGPVLSFWIKAGSVDAFDGVRVRFDNLWFEELGGGDELVCNDPPDTFDGIYVLDQTAPGWTKKDVPGGTDKTWEWGLGRTGDAQTLLSENASIGVYKFFSVPAHSNLAVRVHITSSDVGYSAPFNPDTITAGFGYDLKAAAKWPTLAMDDPEIVWELSPGDGTAPEDSFGTWVPFESKGFNSGTNTCIAVWLMIDARADAAAPGGVAMWFDDLEIVPATLMPTVRPDVTEIRLDADEIVLTFISEPGITYEIRAASALPAADFLELLGELTADAATSSFRFTPPPAERARFLRVTVKQ